MRCRSHLRQSVGIREAVNDARAIGDKVLGSERLYARIGDKVLGSERL